MRIGRLFHRWTSANAELNRVPCFAAALRQRSSSRLVLRQAGLGQLRQLATERRVGDQELKHGLPINQFVPGASPSGKSAGELQNLRKILRRAEVRRDLG